ncbi:hypothetical protein O3S80_49210 [Streptomyces sp. Lzd4kr]|nr:hypothetical protein [Streptomyces sp. Lzd4kr]
MTLDDSLTALAISATLGILAGLTILCATAYLMVCRAIEAHQRVRGLRGCTECAVEGQDAAEQAEHDAQAAQVQARLDNACCERWWTSLAATHDPTCPNNQHRSTT